MPVLQYHAMSDTTPTFTTPTLHMNGTGAKMLTAGYDAADDAFHAFKDAYGQIEFNARDYYVKGPEAWDNALREREAINAKIRDIQSYLDAIRTSIYDQIAEKAARSGPCR